MSSGPIEFMGEEFKDEKPDSEYGGRAGLIQPELVDGEEAHTELEGFEVSGILARAGKEPLSSRAAWTGEPDGPDGEVVDPHTGRVVGPDEHEDVTGTGGQLSDLKPA